MSIEFINDSNIEMVPLHELREHPRNPRKGNVEIIQESLQANGFYGVIIAQRSTKYIVIGNHRFKALKAEDSSEAPVIWLDVDDEEALRIMLTDNRTSDIATYDNTVLMNALKELNESTKKLMGTGYSKADLTEITQGVRIGQKRDSVRDEENKGSFDPRDEMEKKWRTQVGQIWKCGDHKLVIGSATDPATVQRLLGDEVPILMVTDPPYGVNYDPNWRNETDSIQGWVRSTGTVQNDDEADWREAYALFPGDVAYVWHAAIFTDVIMEGLRECKFVPRTMVVWKKQHFAFSRSHYHQQYEMAWYAVKKGKTANWQGGRKQSNVWEIKNLSAFGGGGKDPLDEMTGHGTQKPIECMRRPIENHTTPGQLVYDPFLGSGTTLVAAESCGRRAYGCELDPGYGAIILNRMERIGLKPELVYGELSDIADIDNAKEDPILPVEEPSSDKQEVNLAPKSKEEKAPPVPKPIMPK